MTGSSRVFWAGQERRAVLTLTAEKDSSARVWQTVQTELSAALSSAQPADVYAIASLWEAPQETILRWRSRVEALPIGELLTEASDFITALERFSPDAGDGWRAGWYSALADRLMSAIERLTLSGVMPLSSLYFFCFSRRRVVSAMARFIDPVIWSA